MIRRVSFFKNDNGTDPIQLFIEINKILNAPDKEEVKNEKDSDIYKAEYR